MYRTTQFAMDHLLQGQLALADIERNGVRVDKTYMENITGEIDNQIDDLKKELTSSKIFRQWKKVFGDKANLKSRPQLAEVLFKHIGFQSAGQTTSGRDRTDKMALDDIDHPFIRKYVEIEELEKVKNTYIRGIQREIVERGGMYFVHPSYNLNTTRTMRSSCDNPNFQNVPIRNPRMAEIIRKCYIPRFDHFGEPDYSQIEVRISTCYHKDPEMIRYNKDPTTDMHRDTACDLFLLPPDKISKEVRHTAKNMFVFPEFYGSVYFQCAPSIWDSINRRNLMVEGSKTTILEHLNKKGITELGDCDPKAINPARTFVSHIKDVEKKFWDRFRIYTKWKKDWYQRYLDTGGWLTHFGFGFNGHYKRNDVINYPIQCDAFHCNLWAISRINKWLRKNRFRSLVVGEIHDSIQLDLVESELDDVLSGIRKIMLDDLLKAFPWIIVPLESEVDIAPKGKSWNDKTLWVCNKEHWAPKSKDKK